MALRREASPQSAPGFAVAPMRSHHLASCCRIDRQGLAQEDRWPETTWYDAGKEFAGLVAVDRNAVLGYVLYEARAAYVRLARIGVHPTCRRAGIGSELARRVYLACRDLDRKYVEATVPLEVASIPTLLFFKSLGWIGYMTETGDCVAFLKENRVDNLSTPTRG